MDSFLLEALWVDEGNYNIIQIISVIITKACLKFKPNYKKFCNKKISENNRLYLCAFMHVKKTLKFVIFQKWKLTKWITFLFNCNIFVLILISAQEIVLHILLFWLLICQNFNTLRKKTNHWLSNKSCYNSDAIHCSG